MENNKNQLFFYVDESGNTGINLFDEAQPFLHYGVLSSLFDLDVDAKDLVLTARSILGVNKIHANEIGFKGIELIVN